MELSLPLGRGDGETDDAGDWDRNEDTELSSSWLSSPFESSSISALIFGGGLNTWSVVVTGDGAGLGVRGLVSGGAGLGHEDSADRKSSFLGWLSVQSLP